jgi:hypothetical protein
VLVYRLAGDLEFIGGDFRDIRWVRFDIFQNETS